MEEEKLELYTEFHCDIKYIAKFKDEEAILHATTLVDAMYEGCFVFGLIVHGADIKLYGHRDFDNGSIIDIDSVM